MEIDLPYGGWSPREYQRGLWRYLNGGGRRAVAIWHRRAGKDEICLHWACIAAHERPAVYWHMLPRANQARKAIWDAVNPHTGRRRIDECFPRELREVTRENEMMIRFRNGAVWQVVGSDNYNALMGAPPAGIVYSEYAIADPRSWDYMRPILAENSGWAAFITTPRGRNHAWHALQAARTEPGWFADIKAVEETGAIQQETLDQELRELIRLHGEDEGRAMFDQEYRCSFDAPLVGSIYGAQLAAVDREKRIIANLPHEPHIPVNTAWDLGMDDATAIWFYQAAGPQVRFLKYLEGSNRDLPSYAVEIQNIYRDRGWLMGQHNLPHDVEVRELGTGKTRREVLESCGLRVQVAKKLPLMDGITSVKTMFNKFWFDGPECENGLEALRNYRREWDDLTRTFGQRPVHDWSSHAADALRTMGLNAPAAFNAVEWGKPINYPKVQYT